MDGNDYHNYRRQATQGMLHMIDTAPKSALRSRQEQHVMIQQHLREHAYYKRPLERKGRVVLRTEYDCKQLLSELAHDGKLGRLKRADETTIDVMLRVGSSGLPETVLQKYDYDLATFDPATLPGPPPNTHHLGLARPPKGGNSNSRWSDHTVSDEDDDASDDVEDGDFLLPTSSINDENNLVLLPAVATQQHALWTLLQDIDATSHLANHAEWKYRDKITRLASHELLIKQFSLVHRRYGVIYPYTAESLQNSLKDQFKARKLPELRQKPFSHLYKLGSEAFEPQYVYQLKKSYEMVIEKTDRPPYGSLPRYSTSAEVFAELNGDKVESELLHEDDEDERNSQSGQDIDHTSRSSSLTEASWRSAESTGSNSAPSELNVSLRKSIITEESSASPRRRTPSLLTTPAAPSPKPIISNLAGWESDLDNLSKRITKAVKGLFTNLSLPSSQVSPYLPPSALALRSVSAACFGDDFQSTCASLRGNDSLSAFNVTQCLIAALIHEYLLKDKLDWQRALCIQLGWSKIEDVQNLFTMLRDPLQNAEAREKHLPRRFAQAILKSADDDHDRAVLPLFIQRFTKQLSNDLEPYIETLVQIAALLNQETVHASETWQEEFDENIAAIVMSAAHLKLKLTSSEIRHRFFWPTAGEQLHGHMHKAINASGDSLAFTVMPGLRLVEGESTTILPAHVVCYSSEEEEET